MAEKSPEKASSKRKPRKTTEDGSSPPAVAHTDRPSSLPPVPMVSPLLARRLGARVLDPDTATLAPGRPTPLPTVYVGDTLLVRDVRDEDVDVAGLPSRVEELIEFAANLPDPFVVEPLGDPLLLRARGEAADQLGPDAHVTLTRIRLSRDPSKASKLPDAWRFYQTALVQPSERGALLYDKLGVGRLPAPEGDLDDAEKRRRERRDRRGRSMASGVNVEHVLTAGGGVWGGTGGVWGGTGGVWGGSAGPAVSGEAPAERSPSTALQASEVEALSCGRRRTPARGSSPHRTHRWSRSSTPVWASTRGSPTMASTTRASPGPLSPAPTPRSVRVPTDG